MKQSLLTRLQRLEDAARKASPGRLVFVIHSVHPKQEGEDPEESEPIAIMTEGHDGIERLPGETQEALVSRATALWGSTDGGALLLRLVTVESLPYLLAPDSLLAANTTGKSYWATAEAVQQYQAPQWVHDLAVKHVKLTGTA